TGAQPDDQEHQGVAGDFDEADETRKMPATPGEGDESSEKSDPDSYVTGDDDASGKQDVPEQSAAWSTPAGVVGEWPDRGRPVPPDDRDAGSASAGAEHEAAGTSAGGSGQNSAQADERHGVETANQRRTEPTG